MLIHGAERSSQVATCIAAASSFLLGREEAISIVNHQVHVIERDWQTICDEAGLSEVDRTLFWRRQFLNPFAFLSAPEGVRIPMTG
jgi:serine/threonine-protein kinase HipA